MKHPILLGLDSWMRFERRSYTTLPREPQLPHQPPRPTRGELSLHHHDPNMASAFIPDDRYTDDVYHLRFAGTKVISFSSSPKLVKVNLVHQSGAPAFTGHYMVNMLSREDLLSDKVIFGHQTIPLSGSTDLEPGDLLGTSLSPLVQVPLATLEHPSFDPPAPPPMPGVHAPHDKIPGASENPPPADPHVPRTAPCPQLFARLDADQRTSFVNPWDRLLRHLRDIVFDLNGSGWSPSVIDSLGDVL